MRVCIQFADVLQASGQAATMEQMYEVYGGSVNRSASARADRLSPARGMRSAPISRGNVEFVSNTAGRCTHHDD